VLTLADEYSQLERQVESGPLPETAYEMPSSMIVVPLEPAYLGSCADDRHVAVTAGPHFDAVLRASEGTVVAHDDVLGSPMTMAEYEAKFRLE